MTKIWSFNSEAQNTLKCEVIMWNEKTQIILFIIISVFCIVATEDLAEGGSMDTQGETHLLTFDNGGLTSK